ncbi:tho complex subunit 2 [Lasius niger]|uniref:Tho complex subunit 2 n=1 Tax=Lasius niger TaxID=67767 RepID=A0A0J7KXN0_LASNI|nr:tho complex subunit 2 [Lasius niger]
MNMQQNFGLAHRNKLLCSEVAVSHFQAPFAGISLEPAGQIPQNGAKAITPKSFCQRGEMDGFGNNNPKKANRDRIGQNIDKGFGRMFQRLLGRKLFILKNRIQILQMLFTAFAKKGRKQFLLICKMVIKRSLGNPCLLRNDRHRGAAVALFQKDEAGILENLLSFGIFTGFTSVYRKSFGIRHLGIYSMKMGDFLTGQLKIKLTERIGHVVYSKEAFCAE